MSDSSSAVQRIKMHEQGPEFSGVIWGSMRCQSQFDGQAALTDHLAWLADRGVTTLDTAATYGDPHPFTVEEFLKPAIAEVGREKFEIVTKCGIQRITPERPECWIRHFDFSAKEIRFSAERSLQKLGIDEIDLLLLHRPDFLMDPAETAGELDKLVAEGKVRHVGVSNLNPSRFSLVQKWLKAPIVTNQIQFSPIYHEPIRDGVLDMAIREGHRPMIWSPVGGGRLLTGDGEDMVAVRAKLEEVAKKYGLPGAAEAAMAFVVRHPAGGVPIVGSGKRERVEGAIQAANTAMERPDWYDIIAATNPDYAF